MKGLMVSHGRVTHPIGAPCEECDRVLDHFDDTIGKEYLCEGCQQVFTRSRSDRDADREAKELWGVDNASHDPDMAIICHDCFIKIMGNIENI